METVTITDINRKLDLIIDALGLSKHPKLSPAQVKEKVQNDVLLFQKKRLIKNGHDNQES